MPIQSPIENSKTILTEENVKHFLLLEISNIFQKTKDGFPVSMQTSKKTLVFDQKLRELKAIIDEWKLDKTDVKKSLTSLFQEIKEILAETRKICKLTSFNVIVRDFNAEIEQRTLNSFRLPEELDETPIISLISSGSEYFSQTLLSKISKEILKLKSALKIFTKRDHFAFASPYLTKFLGKLIDTFEELSPDKESTYKDLTQVFQKHIFELRSEITKESGTETNEEKIEILSCIRQFLDDSVQKLEKGTATELLSENYMEKLPEMAEIQEISEAEKFTYFLFSLEEKLLEIQTRDQSQKYEKFSGKELYDLKSLLDKGLNPNEIASYLNENHHNGLSFVRDIDIENYVSKTAEYHRELIASAIKAVQAQIKAPKIEEKEETELEDDSPIEKADDQEAEKNAEAEEDTEDTKDTKDTEDTEDTKDIEDEKNEIDFEPETEQKSVESFLSEEKAENQEPEDNAEAGEDAEDEEDCEKVIVSESEAEKGSEEDFILEKEADQEEAEESAATEEKIVSETETEKEPEENFVSEEKADEQELEDNSVIKEEPDQTDSKSEEYISPRSLIEIMIENQRKLNKLFDSKIEQIKQLDAEIQTTTELLNNLISLKEKQKEDIATIEKIETELLGIFSEAEIIELNNDQEKIFEKLNQIIKDLSDILVTLNTEFLCQLSQGKTSSEIEVFPQIDQTAKKIRDAKILMKNLQTLFEKMSDENISELNLENEIAQTKEKLKTLKEKMEEVKNRYEELISRILEIKELS